MSNDQLMIRPTLQEDAPMLREWLSEEETGRYFPVQEENEIKEASERWCQLAVEEESGLTALWQGNPVGIMILFVQSYVKLRHQSLHILCVASAYRRMGFGSRLLQETLSLCKKKEIELLHVEVYEDPGFEAFYRNHGFVEFARQPGWSKEGEEYLGRVCFERFV